MDEPADDFEDWSPPTGWVPLGQKRWSRLLGLGGFGFAFILLLPIVNFIGQVAGRSTLMQQLPPWMAAAVSFGSGFVLLVGVLFLIDRTSPRARANFDTGQVRAGRKTVPMTSIDRATIMSLDGMPGTDHTLKLLLQGDGAKFGVVLRGTSWTLKPEYRYRVAEVLRLSTVAMPTSSYDPTGKFARYNFPGSLTKEDALAVVLDPPAPGDPLPVLGGQADPEHLRRIE